MRLPFYTLSLGLSRTNTTQLTPRITHTHSARARAPALGSRALGSVAIGSVAGGVRLPANLIPLPKTRQATDYTCGAAVTSIASHIAPHIAATQHSPRTRTASHAHQNTAFALIAVAPSKGAAIDP